MKVMVLASDWFTIGILIFLTIFVLLEIRKVMIMKKKLLLEREIFQHEKDTLQYADAIATAKRIVDSPKHSRR